MKADQKKEITGGVRPESYETRGEQTDSTILAALTISRYTGLVGGNREVADLAAELSAQCGRMNRGDLRRAEVILAAQAHTLDAIFNRLATEAAGTMHDRLAATEVRLRLAFKAQAQCRATLEAIVAIKNPVVFARQANIAHGPQQVNNGVSTADSGPPENRESMQNRLLDFEHGERMERGTQSPAGGTSSEVAAVGAIHRPEDERRQKTSCQ